MWGDGCLHGEHESANVERENLVPLFTGHCFQSDAWITSRIVDQHVNAIIVGGDTVDPLDDFRFTCQVDFAKAGRGTEFCLQRLSGSGIDVAEVDARALGRKLADHRRADPVGAAGDHDHFVVEVVVVGHD